MPELIERLAHQIQQVKAAKERLDAESQALSSVLAEVSEAHPPSVDSTEMMWRKLEDDMLRKACRAITAAGATPEAQDASKRAEPTSAASEPKKAPPAPWTYLDGYMRY